ncbi:hypothetical protein BDV59DRAFT_40408 [Aspergillus ambiguus]|uniref:uncharacterized protein n=1 Tax=Aspergillus ambiguus TaxID=176160 RepID=UPI003CCD1EBE
MDAVAVAVLLRWTPAGWAGGYRTPAHRPCDIISGGRTFCLYRPVVRASPAMGDCAVIMLCSSWGLLFVCLFVRGSVFEDACMHIRPCAVLLQWVS